MMHRVDRAHEIGGVVATASRHIEHVFVLVLENRSFDHMLGFSGITGTDAVNGERRSIEGLVGTEANSYQGRSQQQRVARARSVHTRADARDYLQEVDRRLINASPPPH